MKRRISRKSVTPEEAEQLGGFLAASAKPISAEDRLLNDLIVEFWSTSGQSEDWHRLDVAKISAVREIKRLKPSRQMRILEVLLPRLTAAEEMAERYRDESAVYVDTLRNERWQQLWRPTMLLLRVMEHLLEKKLPLGEAANRAVIDWALKTGIPAVARSPFVVLVEAAEALAREDLLDSALIEILGVVLSALRAHRTFLRTYGRDAASIVPSLEKLVGSQALLPLDTGEAWSDVARARIPKASRPAWREIFDHCLSATSGTPSPKWLARSKSLLATSVARREFRKNVLTWFPLVSEPRVGPSQYFRHLREGSWHIVEGHMDLLRGLAWMCGLAEDRELARALTALAINTFKKLPGIGPRAVRVGNAHALCAARGWKNRLRLAVDDVCPPATRLLPLFGLRAEFWITSAGEDTNNTGSYLHLATDQVRFYTIDAPQVAASSYGGGYGGSFRNPVPAEPVPLAEIPPLVFSEIMREVDLFVGVASVGNDPAWADGGRRDAERDAWTRFSFGDLSATAQTRRDLLQRLVPKLKIADRCSFADKFLVVRGDRRTYKIHLGSGNILMSPNDTYLCIVPGPGKAEEGKVFLPFEGDRTLSVILSKAFLLAADAKITDPSIVAQIGRA